MRAVPSAVRAFSAIVIDAAKSNRTEQPSFYHVLCGNDGQWRVGSSKCRELGGLITRFLSRQVRCSPCRPPWVWRSWLPCQLVCRRHARAFVSSRMHECWDPASCEPLATNSGLPPVAKLSRRALSQLPPGLPLGHHETK